MADTSAPKLITENPIHCACVIHGDVYDWSYVERLYSMLKRNFSCDIKFHVYTEPTRKVPDYMIKHGLTEWPGVKGHRKGWWYKMQLFNSKHFAGRLFYFDLDIVVLKNLDWMLHLPIDYFCTLRDFKHLWKPNWQGINSSIMVWDTTRYAHIWDRFLTQDIITKILPKYPGDQDYLSAAIPQNQIKFFDDALVQSWRWQVVDGGLDFKSRNYRNPGAGAQPPSNSTIVVFHGKPKPHEVTDTIITRNWC